MRTSDIGELIDLLEDRGQIKKMTNAVNAAPDGTAFALSVSAAKVSKSGRLYVEQPVVMIPVELIRDAITAALLEMNTRNTNALLALEVIIDE